MLKNVTALYEYHHSTRNANRSKQIIQACFAHMSQCLDHRPWSLYSWLCQYLSLLTHCLFFSLGKHPRHLNSAENADHCASLKHLYSYISFHWTHFEQSLFQRLVQHVCHWYAWDTNRVFAYINFIRIVLPSHLPKSLKKWNNVCNVIYPQSITHCGKIIFLEQF